MLVQLLDDCVNLIVHGTVPEDVFLARLYVNRVMSSLTHAFTMDDKRRSEWRSQQELETRAKISQTFHVCKGRLSILLATQQVSWDETLYEFKGPDGCRHFFFASSLKTLERNSCGLAGSQAAQVCVMESDRVCSLARYIPLCLIVRLLDYIWVPWVTWCEKLFHV